MAIPVKQTPASKINREDFDLNYTTLTFDKNPSKPDANIKKVEQNINMRYGLGEITNLPADK